MAFMEGGFPLEKAKALIAMQDETKEYLLRCGSSMAP